MSRPPVLPSTLMLLAIAAAGLLSGYLAYHGLHSTPLTTSAPSIGVPSIPSTPTAPESGSSEPPRAVPQSVPDLTLPDLSDRPRALRSFLGHPLIINFWATWCEPCRREMPLLARLREQHRREGLEVLGVAVDFPSAVLKYLKQNPVPYPLLAGETQGLQAIEAFGMQPALPFSVFADARGDILAVKLGELHPEEADAILGALNEVSAGRETLPAARASIAQRLRTLAITRAKTAT